MKNLIVLLIVGTLAWYGWGQFKARNAAQGPASAAAVTYRTPTVPGADAAEVHFTCDGRTHCSQMRSCAEATYFIRHCPGTQMDGNNDGVPCEKQWCN